MKTIWAAIGMVLGMTAFGQGYDPTTGIVYMPNGMTVNAPLTINGAAFSDVKTIFIATNTVTIANTAAATSVIPNGLGTTNLPANYFSQGLTNGHTAIELDIAGYYSTPGVVASTVTIVAKLGGTTLASVATTSLATGASGYRFFGDLTLICTNVISTTGYFYVDGAMNYLVSAGGNPYQDPMNNAGAPVSVTVNATAGLSVAAQWDSATTSRTATITKCIIKALN